MRHRHLERPEGAMCDRMAAVGTETTVAPTAQPGNQSARKLSVPILVTHYQTAVPSPPHIGSQMPTATICPDTGGHEAAASDDNDFIQQSRR